MTTRPGVLIVVQNLPLRVDRRVLLEAKALVAAGYQVSVICPLGEGDRPRQMLEGVAVYSYRPAPGARGLLGYVIEFVYSWFRTAWLSVAVRRERGFRVIQACNPPDTYWLLALLWRPFGVRFVFDHHDLNPELYRSRFGEPQGAAAKAQYRGLLWLERRTFRAAHRVISTNESYQEIAQTRGGVPARRTSVVRSAPDATRMRPVHLKRADQRGHLLAYLGIMGPQDDVHIVLEVIAELVHRRGRVDVHAVLMGFGDCLADLRKQCTEMGLDGVVTFTGRVGPEQIGEHLSRASIGLGPDRNTPLNDVSTMNKTMEYMAYAVVPVTFDLQETRRSLGDAGVVVASGDVQAFADAIEGVLDDEERRVRLSLAGRRRIVDELDWAPQSGTYVGVFDELLGRPHQPLEPAPAADQDQFGRRYVTDAELEAFVRARGHVASSDDER
ncbi:glycosyltransferase family 4 protein [Pseudactinotalea terrae]|uniref:glycosyltransferase family 4 protein n=1 Tax=Pseudactinotalea terrae TaxID=1743262 RepID=UPI0012E1FCE0|nr:glycosyltransferase family 4 protein [Pseudactinotalea terrae]